ncbi:MAG: nitrilase-related carbon-nitrogen hydrolase [Myxococcota bacterium]
MDRRQAPFRAAAVQLSPVLMDRDGTTEKVVRAIERCGREGVRLAVLPETVIPSYPYFALLQPPIAIGEALARLYDQAVDVPGPVTEAVGAAARQAGTVVVLGVNERDGGSLYNTQLLFDAEGPCGSAVTDSQRTPTGRSWDAAARSCPPSRSGWSGAGATGAAFAPGTPPSVASGHSSAGSTTCPWHATR